MKRLFVILLVLVVLVPLGQRASASPRRADGSVTHDLSKTRYAEGMRLYEKKRYEEARAAFLQAHALDKRPAVTLMLGLTSLKTGRALEALSWFDAYLAAAPDASEKARAIVDGAKKEA